MQIVVPPPSTPQLISRKLKRVLGGSVLTGPATPKIGRAVLAKLGAPTAPPLTRLAPFGAAVAIQVTTATSYAKPPAGTIPL